MCEMRRARASACLLKNAPDAAEKKSAAIPEFEQSAVPAASVPQRWCCAVGTKVAATAESDVSTALRKHAASYTEYLTTAVFDLFRPAGRPKTAP
jgi:hypothetical protein